MAVSRREEFGLAMGVLLLLFALGCGIRAWHARWGRVVVWGALSMAACLGIIAAILAEALPWPSRRARETAAQEEAAAMRRVLADRDALRQNQLRDPVPALNANAPPAPDKPSAANTAAWPVVVRTFPEAGASNVPSDLDQILVTFSKPMLPGSWSWGVVGEDKSLQQAGVAQYVDAHTWALKVPLEPGRVYGFWLNGETAAGFKDAAGVPALPYVLVFETRK
jgi:type II secretory pathway pseudopilin PulG